MLNRLLQYDPMRQSKRFRLEFEETTGDTRDVALARALHTAHEAAKPTFNSFYNGPDEGV
jgi:hypothetical protein